MRSGVARQATQHSADTLGIAPAAVDAVDVEPTDLVDVGACGPKGDAGVSMLQPGPAADRDALGDLGNAESGVGAAGGVACEEASQRDRTVARAALEQAHRPHPQPADAASAGMTRHVVGRDGGTRQQELPGLATVVDRTADVVPDPRLDLPLVDQPRRRSVEHELRVELDRSASVRVDVEPHVAGGDLERRRCLATGLRPLDDHSA